MAGVWESWAEAVQALQEFKHNEMAGWQSSQYEPHPDFRSKQSRASLWHLKLQNFENICIHSFHSQNSK